MVRTILCLDLVPMVGSCATAEEPERVIISADSGKILRKGTGNGVAPARLWKPREEEGYEDVRC